MITGGGSGKRHIQSINVLLSAAQEANNPNVIAVTPR
jgi:hypothetical protein